MQRHLKNITAWDVEGILALFAEDAVVEDPIEPDAHVGIKGVRDFYSNALKNQFTRELTGPVRCVSASLAFPFLLTLTGVRTNNIIDVFDLNQENKIVSMKAC